jgi:hypothetical protein
MEKEIDFLERLNRAPNKYSTPAIVTTRKEFIKRKLQTECLLDEFSKDFIQDIYLFFTLKLVEGIHYPRLHIAALEDINDIDEDKIKEHKLFQKYTMHRVAFMHSKTCMASKLQRMLESLPFIEVSPPKNKFHFSTACLILDKHRNIA